MNSFIKDNQYYKFSAYGFLKNLRFFDAFFIIFLVANNMSYTQIGILYAIREIIINVFEIPSGIIADSYGRKTSLVASMIIYLISFGVFYISTSFWLYLFAFSLYGIADAFRSGTHKGMMMDYLKLNNWSNHKILYYGHTRSWSQKGSAISSLIAGILVYFSGNYHNIFLYSMIPYLINLIVVLSYPKEVNYALKKKGGNVRLTTKSLINTLRQPNVIKLINTTALHSAYLKSIKDYIQPLLINIAIILPFFIETEPEKKNGLFIGVFYFIIYLITSHASKHSSKAASGSYKNIPYLTLIIGFIAGVLSGAFYINNLWILSVIFFVAIYYIENLRKPILTGYVSDHVPNEILTSVLSVQSLLKTGITAILALVFGLIADSFGIGMSLIAVSLSLLILSTIINISVKK